MAVKTEGRWKNKRFMSLPSAGEGEGEEETYMVTYTTEGCGILGMMGVK